MFSDGRTNRIWLTFGVLMLGAVFLTDIWLPLGVVTGPLYVLVALCALRASPRNAIVLGAIATVANVVAYGLAPAVGVPEWMVGASRVIAVCTTWLLIVIGLHFHQQSQLVIAKLQDSTARLRLASEAAELGFWSNDLSTGDVVFDERWVGMLGYRPEEVEYTAAWYDRLIHPNDRSDVELAWRKHLSGQSESFEVEHCLRTKDGNWRRILSKGRVIARDATGTPLRAAGTHLDVTVTRELERQAEHAREALALHTNRGIANEMAAAIAHELNQPLATISVYASELVRSIRNGSSQPEEWELALVLIDQESQRAGQIMRKVRELVDNREPKTNWTDVRKLMESVRQVCDFRTRFARIGINICVDDTVNAVDVDSLQLQQVLVNLVNNAIDASQDVAGDRRQVTIEASSGIEGIHMRVIDRGHGLPGPHWKRIFTPYFTTKPDGLGIGLNICQSIVAAHGGKLWATQNENDGATFHVLLPQPRIATATPATLCVVS